MLVNKVLLFTLALVVSLNSFAAGAGDSVSAKLAVTQKETGAPMSISVNAVEVGSESELDKAVNAQIKDKNATYVVSTDDSALIETLATNKNVTDNVIVAPYQLDDSTAPKKKPWKNFVDVVKAYPGQLIEAAKSDRIGLLIVTLTTANETFVWLHTGGISNFERTSSIVFAIATSIFYGVDKTAWARSAKPFKTYFRKVLGIQEGLNRNDPKELGATFLANLALSTTIGFARLAFVSMDQVMNVGLNSNSMTITMLMSLVSTMASFAWSENIALIDHTKPVSQFVFRRAQEIRSMVLGMFATTAYLLHPEVYGWTSWVVMTSVGGIGLTAYLNNDRITEILDSNKLFQRLANRWLEPAAPMCSEILL
jgi:hypothetical protein